jgi:hypothetical protein
MRCTSGLALALMLAAGAAEAQVASMTLQWSQMAVTHETVAGQPVAGVFEVDRFADAVQGTFRPFRAGDITLKRGQFYPADPLPQTLLLFDIVERTGRQAMLGSLAVSALHGGEGAEGHVRVAEGLRGGGPRTVVFGGATAGPPAPLELVVQPVAGAQLGGEPAALFNRPARGEALVARIPPPAADSGVKVFIDVVYNAADATVRLRFAPAVR